MRAKAGAVQLLRELRASSSDGVWGLVKRQFYREWHAYGLTRDLMIPREFQRPRIPIAIRELKEEDIQCLFSGAQDGLSRRARLEIAHRVALIAERIPTPYVAVDLLRDRPCFLQWLMLAQSNERIQRFFNGRFPILTADQGLLEYAYTPIEYRGNGIMPAAMAMISEKAAERGCRSLMTFVLRENAAALQGCARAGFVPFTLRRDRHYLFRLIRRRSFVRINNNQEVNKPSLIHF